MSFLNPTSTPPYKSKPLSVPSPTPSASSAAGGFTKKRKPAVDMPAAGHPPAGVKPPLSTAAINAGMGHEIMTHVFYAIDHLKTLSAPISFQDLVTYLSIQGDAFAALRPTIRKILAGHERVDHDPRAGTFRYRPIHRIASAEDLKAHLQAQKASVGLSVRDLRDGWPGAVAAINALEAAGDLLVTRNKKDGVPRTVWQDDRSLAQRVDPEFRAEWHRVKVPEHPEELRAKLEAAGLKPTTAPRETGTGKAKEKKRKVQRRGGKLTNTHMTGVLKDYSDRRK